MNHLIPRTLALSLPLLLLLARLAAAQAVGDPAPVPAKTGGLVGTYYNNTGNGGTGLGPPPVPPPGSPMGANNGLSVQFLQRLDGPIDFNFQTTPPPGVNNTPSTADHFCGVWTGYILITTPGTYKFATKTDDGERAWLNDLTTTSPPINLWQQQGETLSQIVTLTGLTAGQKIPFRFEFYEHEGGAAARLYWDNMTGATPSIPIPAANLLPPDGPNAPTLTASTGSGAAHIDLSWNAASGATGYILSRQAPGGSMQVIALLSGTTYTDTAVVFDSTYSYIVQATSNSGLCIGGASNTASATPRSITASPSSGLQTDENLSTTFFDISLNEALNLNESVSITVTSNNPQEGWVKEGNQAFGPSVPFTVNGPTPVGHTVRIFIQGQNDDFDDGNVLFTISITSTSGVAVFNQVPVPDVSCTNNDNDTAGVTVSRTAGLITSESGQTDQFSVSLTTQPFGPITMQVVSSNPAEGTVSTSQVTFTSAVYKNIPVIITGADDSVLDFTIPYTIFLGPLSTSVAGDAAYDNMPVSSVQVVNLDNEAIPEPPHVWGGSGGGGCGLLGLEAGLLLGLAALLRRRR